MPEFKVEAARDYLQAVAQAVQAQAGAGAEPYYMRARLQSQLGHQDEAERLAGQGLECDPNRADIQSFLADLFIRQDRMEEASRCLRRAVELDPQLAGGWRRLGMVLDRLGDRDGARDAFETGLRQAPKDATARLLLGRLLLDQGQAEEAASHLEKACQLDPELANAFYVLSQAQTRLGAREAAEATLKTFQQLKQKEKAALDAETAGYDNEKAMRTLATGLHTEAAALFLQQKQPALAEAHLRQAVRIAPQEPQGHEMLAAFLLQTGRRSEARPVCEELVRLRPRRVAHRVNLGTLLLQLKDYPAAVEELKRALELDPQQSEALNNLARFYLGARRDLPEALVLCRRLVTLQPTAANYDLLGWAFYANGQTNEARAAAAQAVEKDPTNAVYRERYQRLQPAP